MNHMCATVAGEFHESAITSLAEALAVNSTLKSLNLTWNFLQAQVSAHPGFLSQFLSIIWSVANPILGHGIPNGHSEGWQIGHEGSS